MADFFGGQSQFTAPMAHTGRRAGRSASPVVPEADDQSANVSPFRQQAGVLNRPQDPNWWSAPRGPQASGYFGEQRPGSQWTGQQNAASYPSAFAPAQAGPMDAMDAGVNYRDHLQQMVSQQMGVQQPTAGASRDLAAYQAALPAPNQIVARNWMRLPQSSQEFLLGTYEAMGYDPNDVLEAIQRTTPTWQVPRYGMVR